MPAVTGSSIGARLDDDPRYAVLNRSGTRTEIVGATGPLSDKPVGFSFAQAGSRGGGMSASQLEREGRRVGAVSAQIADLDAQHAAIRKAQPGNKSKLAAIERARERLEKKRASMSAALAPAKKDLLEYAERLTADLENPETRDDALRRYEKVRGALEAVRDPKIGVPGKLSAERAAKEKRLKKEMDRVNVEITGLGDVRDGIDTDPKAVARYRQLKKKAEKLAVEYEQFETLSTRQQEGVLGNLAAAVEQATGKRASETDDMDEDVDSETVEPGRSKAKSRPLTRTEQKRAERAERRSEEGLGLAVRGQGMCAKYLDSLMAMSDRERLAASTVPNAFGCTQRGADQWMAERQAREEEQLRTLEAFREQAAREADRVNQQLASCFKPPNWVMERITSHPQTPRGTGPSAPLPVPFTVEEVQTAVRNVIAAAESWMGQATGLDAESFGGGCSSGAGSADVRIADHVARYLYRHTTSRAFVRTKALPGKRGPIDLRRAVALVFGDTRVHTEPPHEAAVFDLDNFVTTYTLDKRLEGMPDYLKYFGRPVFGILPEEWLAQLPPDAQQRIRAQQEAAIRARREFEQRQMREPMDPRDLRPGRDRGGSDGPRRTPPRATDVESDPWAY